ncbi:hypothetical protein IW262DRAFT_349756 [Armillaria fumosa]|nr:hypothetical protein IW262DRAFT_349756 [Armillaria fumosa]
MFSSLILFLMTESTGTTQSLVSHRGMGGLPANFQHVFPGEDPPASDIDSIVVVSEALYATCSLYFKEQFALHMNDGLKQEELQPLMQNKEAKRAYTKFGTNPHVVSEEVKTEDDTVDLESELESDW